MNSSTSLGRTTLIRDIYRSMINSGRSYAAFTDEDRRLFTALRGKQRILDPMSGYGLLTRFCAQGGQNSYCLEFDVPLYLWQVLCHPANAVGFIESTDRLLSHKSSYPKTGTKAIMSDDYFAEEALAILRILLDLNHEVVQGCFGSTADARELALALLLPFVGRLSCSVRGDNSPHVKQGGICVFSNWQDDYVAYLTAIAAHLRGIVKAQITARHTVQFGDARSFKFPQREFDGLFSSPPYPNHRDFVSMFGPEQQFLELVGRKNNGGKRGALDDIIGSNFVSNKPPRRPESKIANAFFEAIRSLKRNKTARDDDENYYIPYFQNYFADLELAYRNVSMALAKGFEGYIVVVNNTHRGLIVPVAAFLVEAWKSMLYNAEVVKENELFHIGTKNPRARGTRARHTRYEIRIWDS